MIALLAAVAERGEEAENSVEARILEGQLSVVGLDPARPLSPTRAPTSLLEQDRRAVRARDAIARLGEDERVAAVAARRVEYIGRRVNPGQARGAESLLPRVTGLAVGIGPQVDLVEELVPDLVLAQLTLLSSPSARWSQATRWVTPAPLAARPRLARYQS